MKVRQCGLVFALGVFACDADPDAPVSDDAAASAGAGKADDGSGAAGQATEPGALTWAQLQTPAVSFSGGPLFVSNNPEVFTGYGVLAATQGGSPIGWGRRSAGAPLGTWNGVDGAPECEDGGYTSFGVYLAHIRGSWVSNAAVSVVLEAPEGARVVVRGALGTTQWSDAGGYKTIRESWLSAVVAKAYFNGTSSSRTFELPPGQPVVVAEQTVQSLMEGRLEISADACVNAMTVASPPGRATDHLNRAAAGDVKWPGWYGGVGHGRAAGVFGHDAVEARAALTFRSMGVQGVGLLRPEESIVAIGRPSDSAEILFGNYGATIDLALTLVNETGVCAETQIEFVSYIDKGEVVDRTPTQAFFDRARWTNPPTMFWNGPVRATMNGSTSEHHVVLRAAPSAAERSNPNLAMQSMRKTLGNVRLDDGEEGTVRVEFPVPGYIVAPIAVTALVSPC